MPGADSPNIEDDLLKRFNALRAPTDDPVAPVASSLNPSRVIDDATRDAKRDDEELDAIAEGRSLPSSSLLLPNTSKVDAEDDLNRRIRELKGDSRHTFDFDEDDMPDEEVSDLAEQKSSKLTNRLKRILRASRQDRSRTTSPTLDRREDSLPKNRKLS